jgi:hypothetical protein
VNLIGGILPVWHWLRCWATTEHIYQACAAVAAIWAVKTYRRNSVIERARWLSSLYSKFYEQADLKGIREVLDSELPTSTEIQKLVEEQDARFTDYLNFFEFMAYLNECGQLSKKDVRALFHYYLGAIWKHEAVRKYVLDDRNGYDYLKKLLPKLTL